MPISVCLIGTGLGRNSTSICGCLYAQDLESGSCLARDQMVWPEAVGLAVEGIESATFLAAEQTRDIFYNNAVRFFRLDKK